MTEAERRAKNNYMKKSKMVTIQICPSEKDILDWIDTHKPVGTEIKKLIRADIGRGESNDMCKLQY